MKKRRDKRENERKKKVEGRKMRKGREKGECTSCPPFNTYLTEDMAGF